MRGSLNNFGLAAAASGRGGLLSAGPSSARGAGLLPSGVVGFGGGGGGAFAAGGSVASFGAGGGGGGRDSLATGQWGGASSALGWGSQGTVSCLLWVSGVESMHADLANSQARI